MNDRLAERFDVAMYNLYQTAKSEANYTASLFYKMLCEKGGRETARQLINKTEPSDGYTALWELERLDLTVEALVVDGTEWHALFTHDEIERAKKRLEDYRYSPKISKMKQKVI